MVQGCVDAPSLDGSTEQGRLINVWGRRGLADGRFQKPRAMTIDKDDQLYVVDMTGRVQVFDREGNFLRLWRTPAVANGRPTGMAIDNDGHIMVADTHYYRVLFYTPTGEMIEAKTIGGTNGQEPGEFGFVTDAVQDRQGNYYVSEYGQFDRIQKFTSDGEFICQFGKHGSEPMQFSRPQNIVLDENDHLWIADACNHRIQVVDCSNNQPELVRIFGTAGPEIGQLKYPYDLLLDGESLIVCEYGNNRVQRLALSGEPISHWGQPGTDAGQLYQPWAILLDSTDTLHVLDTMNHRMQVIKLT